MTWRCLPPQGWGTRAPWTVPSCWMMKFWRVVEDLLLGQRVAADGDLHDGHAGGAVADDERRRDARRHDLQERLAGGRHLGLGRRDLGPRLEVDADDADAERATGSRCARCR